MKNMGITRKMIMTSLITCVVVIASTSMILNSVIFNYIDQMEADDMIVKFENVELILKREQENLQRTSLDWSHWDPTYWYMTGNGKEEYEQTNLQEATLKQLDLNFMFYIDMQGKMYHNIMRSLTDDDLELLIQKFLLKPALLLNYSDNHAIQSGIVYAAGHVFIVTASPITTTDGQASSNGVLIIGRAVDEQLIADISALTRSNFELMEWLDVKTTDTVIKKTEDTVTASRVIKDINGNYGLVVSLSMDRPDYKLGKDYIKVFIAIFSFMLSVILLMSIFALHKYILKRLLTIHEFIKGITKTKDTQTKLHISGNDEITDIGHSLNQMLAELAGAYKDNRDANEKIQTILEATNDGYLEYNLKTKEFYISPKWSQFDGTEKERSDFDPLSEYLQRIHPDSLVETQKKINDLIYGMQDYDEMECKLIGVDKKIMWVLHKIKIMERDAAGNAVWIIGILLNMTARKEYEEKILRLSYYDKITGIRNRAYMEEKFSEIDGWQDGDYSIIMGDVNGLKLINDTFGHKAGDRFIYTIGQILQEVCVGDSVARWGGDEFVILSLNKEKDYVAKLMQRINEKCEKVTDFGFKVSIALGSANKQEEENVESVMNLAEERMYRRKLTAVKSARNATLVSLEQTLYEKNHETEEHTQRIKNLAFQLGKKLSLSQDQLNELELLSLLHDIGKIGIPEQILNKPDKLTNEEWKVIQQHTEIGYRIAKATPGLEHVAGKILSHHEKFDGTGYPQGLKGEEIPLLSRIITIVDSFDVMIHKRIYKEAATMEYAIEEIKRCSGSQFDPEIVTAFLELQDVIAKQ